MVFMIFISLALWWNRWGMRLSSCSNCLMLSTGLALPPSVTRGAIVVATYQQEAWNDKSGSSELGLLSPWIQGQETSFVPKLVDHVGSVQEIQCLLNYWTQN